jgi:predicted NodU family carbamoyl transferase
MALATASAAEISEPVWLEHADESYFGPDPHRDRKVSQALFDAATRGLRKTDARFTDEENLISAVMKQVQALSVHVMERNIRRAVNRFGIDPGETHLSISGGYALNCPTNSHLIQSFGFRSFSTVPAVNDGGQAIGLGLAAFRGAISQGLRYRFPGAYLGKELPGLTAEEIRAFPGVVAVSKWSYEDAVADLERGPIAWVHGQAEIGPRALGNRSILADPRSIRSKDALNRLKRRQWWRPVAPVVLEDKAAEWFVDARPSPYMLETFSVRPERRHAVEAIAHLDASARVQTVNDTQNPVLTELLKAFECATGVPLLCNTSLNDKEEPIVQEPGEAIAFCRNRGLEVLYLGDYRVTVQPVVEAGPPAIRSVGHFVRLGEREREEALTKANPHRLQLPVLLAHLYEPELGAFGRLDDEEVAENLHEAALRLFSSRPDTESSAQRRAGTARFVDASGRTHFGGSRLAVGSDEEIV